MIARRRGRIVNIASGGGATMLPYFSAYVTGKAALIRFAECLAVEVKLHGIAVFAMGPGTVRTRMSEYSLDCRKADLAALVPQHLHRGPRPAGGAAGGAAAGARVRTRGCPVQLLPAAERRSRVASSKPPRRCSPAKLYTMQVGRLPFRDSAGK